MKTMTRKLMYSAFLAAVILACPLRSAAQSPQARPTPPPTVQTPRETPPEAARTPRADRPTVDEPYSGSWRPGQAPRAASIEGDRSAPQAFSVVLVLGDMQTATAQDNVPAAARKALADMKDFLPYKGYRLLDAQWTLCCGSYPITSRLKGEDQEYELQLSTSNISGGRVNVRFYLSEPALEALHETSTEMRDQLVEIEKRLSALLVERATAVERVGDRHPDIVKLNSQIRELQRQGTDARPRATGSLKRGSRGVIDASFRMDVGETVVVGTSRVKGDKALIALLTAVPPKAAAR
jgi:hypothetical protein